jgi:FKBP-type peptidyl-prolyl cis-trans isomerase
MVPAIRRGEEEERMRRFWMVALAAVTVGGVISGPVAAQKTPKAPTKVAAGKLKALPGGLKYAILKPGKGKVAAHGNVQVHYTGWLQSNGKKFDSSLDRGQPFTFELGHGEVIKGWDQGVKGMKEGEKRQLVVPAALGYGASGTPDGTIPPNATLVFEVELLKVLPGHAH